jgi:hypothetical protein
MMTKTWKARERQVARFFGARGRTPLSGGSSGHTRSDTLHDHLFIEHKHRVKHAVINLWDKINPLAKKENKIPVVTLSVKGRHGFWVLVHSSDLTAVSNQRLISITKNMGDGRWKKFLP